MLKILGTEYDCYSNWFRVIQGYFCRETEEKASWGLFYLVGLDTVINDVSLISFFSFHLWCSIHLHRGLSLELGNRETFCRFLGEVWETRFESANFLFEYIRKLLPSEVQIGRSETTPGRPLLGLHLSKALSHKR